MRAVQEQGLSQRLHRRDPAAFAELWSARQRVLWSIASAAAGDAQSAEAALRETIEAAWAECDRVVGSAAAWLTAVLGRVLLARGAPPRPVLLPAGAMRGRVLRALGGLPGAERTLYLLHELGGLEAEALARLAHIDAAAARRAIQAGRCAVAALVDETAGARAEGRRGGQRRKTRGGTDDVDSIQLGSSRRARLAPVARQRPLRYR